MEGSSAAGPSAGATHALWLQSKLSGDWSAQAAASGLTEDRLASLARMFGSIDPSMVKVRLLLAGLFVPRGDRPRLAPLLSDLAHQAATSQDEWVRATAAVVGDFSGALDMAALVAQFPLARDTLAGLSAQMAGLQTPAALLPQTEQYMHADISRLRPAPPPAVGSGAGAPPGPHFRLRSPPAATLSDLSLGATGGAHAGGGQLLYGAAAGPGLGLGSVSMDGRTSLGGAPSGAAGGADALPRRGLGGGEASMLRSRADVSHKPLHSAPSTPSAKAVTAAASAGATAAAGRPLLARVRSITVPDGAPGSEAGTPASAAYSVGGVGGSASGWPGHGGVSGGGGGAPHSVGAAPWAALPTPVAAGLGASGLARRDSAPRSGLGGGIAHMLPPGSAAGWPPPPPSAGGGGGGGVPYYPHAASATSTAVDPEVPQRRGSVGPASEERDAGPGDATLVRSREPPEEGVEEGEERLAKRLRGGE